MLGSPWVVSKGGLVEQKNREKAKYFPFFLGKGFSHKSNTLLLPFASLPIALPLRQSANVALGAMDPVSTGLGLHNIAFL